MTDRNRILPASDRARPARPIGWLNRLLLRRLHCACGPSGWVGPAVLLLACASAPPGTESSAAPPEDPMGEGVADTAGRRIEGGVGAEAARQAGGTAAGRS